MPSFEDPPWGAAQLRLSTTFGSVLDKERNVGRLQPLLPQPIVSCYITCPVEMPNTRFIQMSTLHEYDLLEGIEAYP